MAESEQVAWQMNTGTNFSELAIIETSLNELASSMEDVKGASGKFKVANFRQIDWNTVETKLMKGLPSTVKGRSRHYASVLGSKETNRTSG